MSLDFAPIKICTISTVMAPLEEVLMFVYYHLNIGIDTVIVFFDDPLDQAIEHLSSNSRVRCIKCDDEYWQMHGGIRPEAIEKRQILNSKIGISIARGNSFDWAFFIDNDELVYTRGNLSEILSGCNADVVKLQLLEAVSQQTDYQSIFEPSLFKKIPSSLQTKVAKLMRCTQSFFDGDFFRGHQASKVAIRLDSKIEEMGIHAPKGDSNNFRKVHSTNIYLLHYDCVGIDAWKIKWTRRMNPASVIGLGGNRKKQQILFENAFKHKNQKEELNNMYLHIFNIPKYEYFVLFFLGLLVNIKLNKKLFKPNN